MTTVQITANNWTELDVTVPATGKLTVQPVGMLLDDTSGTVTLPSPRTFLIQVGTLSFDADPTEANQALTFTFEFETAEIGPFTFAIPNQASVTLVDLVKDYQVDPATFAPAAYPLAAWDQAAAALNAALAAAAFLTPDPDYPGGYLITQAAGLTPDPDYPGGYLIGA